MNKSIIFNLKTISTYFSASFIPMLLNLVANPFIANNMSPIDYAIVGYYTSFNSLITPLISFNFLHYYIRNYFNFEKNGRLILKATIIKILLTYSFFMSIVAILGIWLYICLFNSDSGFPIFPYLLLSVSSIPLSLLISLQTSDFKMAKDSKSFFRFSLSYGIANVVMSVFFVVVLKQGAFGKMFAPIIISLIFCLWVLIKNKDCFKIRVSYSSLKNIFLFCWPLALSATLEYFTSGFDKTFMASLNDTNTYGIYIVGFQMASYVGLFSGSITATFQPDIYESIIKNQNHRLWKTYLIQFLLIFIVVIVFVIFCPYIINILTYGKYVSSTPFARILVFSTIAQNIFFSANNYSIAKGYPKISLLTTITGSITLVILVPYIITKYRFIGAAYMSSVSYLIYALINILYYNFYNKFSLKTKQNIV